MNRKWLSRFVLLLIIVGISIMTIIPTVFDLNEESNYPVKNKINLGLDLQGGLYIVLGIDFEKVYLDEVTTKANVVSKHLIAENELQNTVGSKNISDPKDPRVDLVFSNPSSLDEAHDVINEFFGTRVRVVSKEQNKITLGLNKTFRDNLESGAVTKSIEVIRNRIDEFGVSEPEIVSQGEDRIVVQLPGVKDIDRAKDLIGQTAKLELKMVNEDYDRGGSKEAELQALPLKAQESGIEYTEGSKFSEYVAKMNEFLKNDLPSGQQIVFEKNVDRNQNSTTLGKALVVNEYAPIVGDDLEDARVSFGQDGMPIVSFSLKSKASKTFADLSGDNVGKKMAIILDGIVKSDPVFNERIPGGNATISLNGENRDAMQKDATDLALVLRAGALPVELEFQEQRIVGPSLGHESISKARFAAMIGILCVFAFILFYYKVSGFIGLLTLSINILIVLACLVGLEATLTLPGIAGIALTIGMAVDANIIIFERIKEEVRIGVSGRPAVEAGFAKAFWTIIDANLTTAVAGLALLNFGTGPIRGFAVTLLIGIAATVYSSYFAGKLLFEIYMDKVRGKTVSI